MSNDESLNAHGHASDPVPVVAEAERIAPRRSGEVSPSSERAFGRYHDLALVVLGGALTLVGGIVAQERQADLERERSAAALIESEMSAAVRTLNDLGAKLDPASVRSVRVVRAAERGVSVDSLRHFLREFTAARTEWDLAYNRSRLMASVFFGERGERVVIDFNQHLDWLERAFAHILKTRHFQVSIAKEAGQLPEYRALEKALREEIESASKAIATNAELVFAEQSLFAAQIQARRVGAIDPLARFGALAERRSPRPERDSTP